VEAFPGRLAREARRRRPGHQPHDPRLRPRGGPARRPGPPSRRDLRLGVADRRPRPRNAPARRAPRGPGQAPLLRGLQALRPRDRRRRDLVRLDRQGPPHQRGRREELPDAQPRGVPQRRPVDPLRIRRESRRPLPGMGGALRERIVAERKPDLARRLGSVLRGAQDRSLGLRALREGLISDQELSGPVGVEDLLRGKGIAPEKIKELHAEIDRDDYALFRPDRAMPGEVSAVLGEPDRRLAEFVRVARLGQGGIGEVWKAWDTRLGRWVAVKLPMATPDLEGASERFTREALAAARLTHPSIVSIHRVAEESGRCFIVMQYIEGQPLRRAKLEPTTALAILRDVALAVHYAHEQGVIHRDLKPANIMLDLDGRPFVLDFGLAHLEEAGRVQSRENLVAGTAAYMSPEQARGGPAARERATDVYALGATLYEVVTGRPPYEGATFAETLEKVLHAEPAPPRSLEPSLSRDVEMVIQKAMDKEPARRYATAKEFSEDLDRCLRGEPVLARQGAVGKTIRRGLRQNPRLPWMAAAGILVAVAVGAWVLAGI